MTHKKQVRYLVGLFGAFCLLLGLSACSLSGESSNPQIDAFDTAVALTSAARGNQEPIDIEPTSAPTVTSTTVLPTDAPSTPLPPTDIPTNTPTPVQPAQETPMTVEVLSEQENNDEGVETISIEEAELITILDAQTARNQVDMMLNWYAQTLQGRPFDCQDHNERYDSMKALEIVGVNGSGNRTDRYANTLLGLKDAMTPLQEFCVDALENASTAPVSGQLVSTAYKATQSASETLIAIINEFANE